MKRSEPKTVWKRGVLSRSRAVRWVWHRMALHVVAVGLGVGVGFSAGRTGRVSAAPPRFEPEMSWLENDKVRVGVDLKMGGSITSLMSRKDGRELINNFDHGRQVQMSFYSGPVPFAHRGVQPHPAWRALGWNPVQSGDWAGNPSRVLEHRNADGELYSRVVPMQWPLEGVEGECELESWIRLEGQAVQLRCRLTNRREDRTFYPARHQELPAVYTNGEFRKVVSYTGDRPFTGGALSEWVDPGPPWKSFFATEHWAALVDASGYGLGVWQPATTYWKQGWVAGEPTKQGPRDNSSGYLAPVGLEHIDHNIVYEYEARLVPGTVTEIRSLVKGWESGRGLPSYRFEKGRMGWSVRGGLDAGVPLAGAWRLQAQATTMFLEGPATFWRAEGAGTLKVTGLWRSQTAGRLRVAWKGIRPEDGEGSAVFDVPAGDARSEHSFVLKNQPGYKGGMQRLMLRVEALKPGDTVEIESIRLEP
jgi:hypothetical protein